MVVDLAVMLVKFKEAKRKFTNYATDLSNSNGHTFENALNIFLDFCESDEVMVTITKPLKENMNVDVGKWYEDFSKSGGSLIGSGRFVLPTNEDDRVSLLYQLLLKIRSGELNYHGLCLHAFGATNINEMAYSFNQAVSRPLARGLLQKVEALEAEEVSKKPTLTEVPSTVGFVLSKVEAMAWKDAWRELDRALKAFSDGRMPDCCNNLRMGLMIVLGNMYQLLEAKPPPTEPGKTTDIGPLTKSLKEHGYADDALSLVRQTWSYLSERAHVDKKAGKAPPEHEVMYGLQITFSALEYLLRTFERTSDVVKKL